MKRIIFFLLMICTVMLSFVTASASATGRYLIQMKKDAVMLFSDSEEIGAIAPEYGIYVSESKEAAQKYLDSGMAEFIEPEITYELFDQPTDVGYPSQWQLQMINADFLWDYETYGNDVRVAVIDSGCTVHNDIKSNLLIGYNYVDENTNTYDDVLHGSHVSGIIAAEMNNGGIVGIAPKAKIVPLKCFYKTNGSTVSVSSGKIAQAILDAYYVYNCSVINMSFGGEGDSEILKNAVDEVTANGVICVAAVGNDADEGYTNICYPAGYDNVIGVGACNEYGQRAVFSRPNESVYIYAPGYSVLSLSNTNQYYCYASGTSMASPLVAAAAANALSVNPNLTPDNFRALLASTAQALSETDTVTYGNGILDMRALSIELLSSYKMYISPVNTDSNGTYVTYFNNTSSALTAYSYCAEYDNGRFVSADRRTVYVFPGKRISVHYSPVYSSKYFMWFIGNANRPVTIARLLEVK